LKQEINFRGTVGYRSDDSADAYVQSVGVNYPTTSPQGNNVGWESMGTSPDKADLSLTNDPRLAGVHGVSASSTTPGIYRVDLPAAGKYRIRCAEGAFNIARGANARVFDNTTLLSQIVPPVITTPPGVIDASNTQMNVTDWPSTNSPVDFTFSSTILRFYHGGEPVSGTTRTYIAHLSVETAPSDNTSNGGGMRVIKLRRRKA